MPTATYCCVVELSASGGAANAAGAVAFGGIFIFFIVVIVGSIVMMIFALIDMAKRPDIQWKIAGQEKILWILLVVLVNPFGILSLVYWFNIRKKLIAVEHITPPDPYATYAAGAPWGVPAPGAGPPPGWYPDPSGVGTRYWDGGRWTEHASQ